MKHKISLPSFQIIQKILKSHEISPHSYPKNNIHQLLHKYDKNSLRMKTNFTSLHSIFKKHSQSLINDAYINENMNMVSNLTNIYTFLNYYDKKWMNFLVPKVVKIIKNKLSGDSSINHKYHGLQLENLFKIYRGLIQLKYSQTKDIESLTLIRNQFKSIFKKYILQQTMDSIYFSLQKVHGIFKYLLLDPNRDIELIEQIFKDLEYCFNQKVQHNYPDKNFPYHNTASVYQLAQVYKIKISTSLNQNYHHFLRQSYISNLKVTKSIQQSGNKQFQSRGQSVFQIRFQKHLIELGYQFDRNIKIGIHQYDILIKGVSRQQYYPFRGLNIKNFSYDTKQFEAIREQQRKQFEKSSNIWYRQNLKLWDRNLLINLNGPFHFLYGDKKGLIRSQQVKRQIALHYGYKDFKIINFEQWQKETPNKFKVKEYLDKFISF